MILSPRPFASRSFKGSWLARDLKFPRRAFQSTVPLFPLPAGQHGRAGARPFLCQPRRTPAGKCLALSPGRRLGITGPLLHARKMLLFRLYRRQPAADIHHLGCPCSDIPPHSPITCLSASGLLKPGRPAEHMGSMFFNAAARSTCRGSAKHISPPHFQNGPGPRETQRSGCRKQPPNSEVHPPLKQISIF